MYSVRAQAITRRIQKKNAIQPFRFLDLPPELRNSVYKYAQRARYVSFCRGKFSSDKYLKPFINLIRTNKQIHQEAAGLLYNNVKFTFRSVSGASRWLRCIGSMVKHIRCIVLDARCIKSTASMLRVLSKAISLQVIQLNDSFFRSATYHEIADALKTPMKALVKGRRSKEERIKVLDIVRADLDHLALLGYSPEEITRRSCSDERVVGTRSELRKLLALDRF